MSDNGGHGTRNNSDAYVWLVTAAFICFFFSIASIGVITEDDRIRSVLALASACFLNLATEFVGAAVVFWAVTKIFKGGTSRNENGVGEEITQVSKEIARLSNDFITLKQNQDQLHKQLTELPIIQIETSLNKLSTHLENTQINNPKSSKEGDVGDSEYQSRLKRVIEVWIADQRLELSDITTLRELHLISKTDESELKKEIGQRYNINSDKTT